MPRVVLVRHGESEINAANHAGTKIFCGQFPTPLTERGRQQAREVGAQLARTADLRIDCAVSSQLGRAVETLQILAESLRVAPSYLPPMPGFNERSLGQFEGRSEADIFRAFPEYRDDPRLKYFRNHFQQRAPGGENLTEVTDRVWSAWRTVRSLAGGDVLIVSHGAALQTWLGRALGLSEEATRDLKIPNATPIILGFSAETDDTQPSPGYRLCRTILSPLE